MFGHLREALNVAADILGSAVVVVHDGANLIAHHIPCLANSDIQGKEAGHEAKDKHIDDCLE